MCKKNVQEFTPYMDELMGIQYAPHHYSYKAAILSATLIRGVNKWLERQTGLGPEAAIPDLG